jgi:phosphoglycolate phosphatase
MHNYKLIIFDWDGTLMDSVARIATSMQASARIINMEVPTFDQAKQIIGLSLPKAIPILFPNCTNEQEMLLVEQYKHHYVEINTTPTPMFANALNLLSELKDNNKLLAVATGKARAGLQRVWHASGTEHFFHASRCSDESLSKPNPDMINSLLAELDIKAHEAVMIGDTSYDMEMAQRAGVDRIGVTFGVHDHLILSQHQPMAIVDSLVDLQRLLIK